MHLVPTDASKTIMHKNETFTASYSNIQHSYLCSLSKVLVGVALYGKLLQTSLQTLATQDFFVYFYMKSNF